MENVEELDPWCSECALIFNPDDHSTYCRGCRTPRTAGKRITEALGLVGSSQPVQSRTTPEQLSSKSSAPFQFRSSSNGHNWIPPGLRWPKFI